MGDIWESNIVYTKERKKKTRQREKKRDTNERK